MKKPNQKQIQDIIGIVSMILGVMIFITSFIYPMKKHPSYATELPTEEVHISTSTNTTVTTVEPLKTANTGLKTASTTVSTTTTAKTTQKTTKQTTKTTTSKPVTVKSDADGYYVTGRITAYTHTGNNTASGVYPRANHTIAASSKYPFGTKIEINGVVYTVEDRGGKVQGNTLDIFMDTRDACIQWGAPTITYKVLY